MAILKRKPEPLQTAVKRNLNSLHAARGMKRELVRSPRQSKTGIDADCSGTKRELLPAMVE